jgi:hypothetical protein
MQAMRVRPRFSLRALFVLTAICAVMFAWRQSTLRWSAQRSEALQWLMHSAPTPGGTSAYPKGSVGWSPSSRLPLALWIWASDSSAVQFVWFTSDSLPKDELHWIDEFRRLFPEAQVVAQSGSEWARYWQSRLSEQETTRSP